MAGVVECDSQQGVGIVRLGRARLAYVRLPAATVRRPGGQLDCLSFNSPSGPLDHTRNTIETSGFMLSHGWDVGKSPVPSGSAFASGAPPPATSWAFAAGDAQLPSLPASLPASARRCRQMANPFSSRWLSFFLPQVAGCCRL